MVALCLAELIAVQLLWADANQLIQGFQSPEV